MAGRTGRATSPREWALAVGGGLALSALLVTLLRGGEPDPAPGPPPVTATPAPIAPPAPPAAPAVAPADMSLTGLRAGPDGGMVIIATGGRQYRLTPGRSLPGGLTLVRVEPGRAILSGSSGEQVLAFADTPGATASSAPRPPGGDPTPWRLALRPLREKGQITGWRLDSLAGLEPLARAGLKPGDVLLAVGDNPLFSEEKIIELPQELAAGGQISLTYRRGNRQAVAVVKA
jgi:type II secretory pathway component PulC